MKHGLRVGAAIVAALVLAASAWAAAPAPSSHDRALAAALNAKVTTFRKISANSDSSSIQDSVEKCPAIKKNPNQALAAVFLLIPVFLTEIVNDYGPQIRELRHTMTSMHPDSTLFRNWITAEGQSVTILLEFDNHGKKVDLCDAVTVLLAKSSTDADIYRTIGIHSTVIAKLFTSNASTTVTKLSPRMRTFFVAAGLSAKDAKTLTS